VQIINAQTLSIACKNAICILDFPSEPSSLVTACSGKKKEEVSLFQTLVSSLSGAALGRLAQRKTAIEAFQKHTTMAPCISCTS